MAARPPRSWSTFRAKPPRSSPPSTATRWRCKAAPAPRSASPPSARSSPAAPRRSLIAFAAPPLAAIALQFGPAEYFSLMVCGLIAAVVLARGSVVKAVGMVVLGLLLGLAGTDVNSGIRRFDFGFQGLADGIEFVALSMAIYGIAEVAYNLEKKREPRRRRPAPSAACGRARRHPPLHARDPARHRRSARCSACCRAAARCSRPSAPIRWRRRSPSRRATSATATSAASRRRNPPTMPARRPRSSRC